jgi:hypothetical protein
LGEKLLGDYVVVAKTELYPKSMEVPSAKLVKIEFYISGSFAYSPAVALIMDASAKKLLLVVFCISVLMLC